MPDPIYLDGDRASATLCKRHLSEFVKEFWDVIVPNPMVWNWHMQALCDEIQEADERVFKRQPKYKDIIFNVPPGTSKTKIVSVLSTAWEFARMPSIKVFVGSYSDAAISGISDEIRLVMKSEKYRKFFPDTIIRQDRDSIHNVKTTENGEFYAFTVGGTLTSKHADILKIDDPLNPKQAVSAAELLSTNAFFDTTLPSRKVDKEVTVTYLVMQRLATNDPTGHLLEKKKGEIHHVCFPATLADNVSPAKYRKFYQDGFMDIKRLGPKALRDSKLDLGEANYSGQLQQSPVPPGGLIWKRKWFIEVPDNEFPDIKRGQSVGSDWDLAYTKNDSNAATAYITSFKHNNRVFIDDFGWEWLEFPEMLKWIKTKPGPYYIEAKASGKSAKQTLVKQGIPAIEVKIQGGADKEARAKMATPMAEAGLVCIRKSMADRFFNNEEQGVLFFPLGKFADLADTLSQCLQRHNTAGIKYHSREIEVQDDEDLLDQLEF